MVPGNHDIKFNENSNGLEKGQKVNVASKEAQENYVEFYHNIFQVRPKEEFFCSVRRLLLRNNMPVELIGLDSNVLQQTKDAFVGQGFVGSNQLKYLATQMELQDNEEVYSYRILILHHHLIPAWYQEEPEIDHSYSVLLDSGRVQEFIKKYQIKLVIHGHNHENLFTRITIPACENSKDSDYTYHILGIGSAGACGRENCFGVLDFDEMGKVNYMNFRINPQGKDDLPSERYEMNMLL